MRKMVRSWGQLWKITFVYLKWLQKREEL